MNWNEEKEEEEEEVNIVSVCLNYQQPAVVVLDDNQKRILQVVLQPSKAATSELQLKINLGMP